jgi:hypothetical protein
MDIVERLRDWCEDPHDVSMGELAEYSHEAANKIEQLREALQFYAEWGIDAPAVDAIIEEDRGDKARAALNIVLANLENGD